MTISVRPDLGTQIWPDPDADPDLGTSRFSDHRTIRLMKLMASAMLSAAMKRQAVQFSASVVTVCQFVPAR